MKKAPLKQMTDENMNDQKTKTEQGIREVMGRMVRLKAKYDDLGRIGQSGEHKIVYALLVGAEEGDRIKEN